MNLRPSGYEDARPNLPYFPAFRDAMLRSAPCLST